MNRSKKTRLIRALPGLAALAVLLLPLGAGAEPLAASLGDALGVYEEMRSELAADRLAPATATRLAAALRSAAEVEGAGAVAETIDRAARAADDLTTAADLAAARLAFGEVSRQVLILAARDRGLVEGWHVFTCPMAEGFERWIQPTETMENPYMGPAMLRCGSVAEWPTAEALAARETPPAVQQATADQPKLEPGIPGLLMDDVRNHKFLWREIDQLQAWERGGRISAAEYHSKVIEKTSHFLELEGSDAERFATAAEAAVEAVRQAFRERPAVAAEPGYETSGLEGRFSPDLDAAVSRLTAVLGDAPRHQLFAPGGKKWLLKLAFGPREAPRAGAQARSAAETEAGRS